ncbi:MAG: Tat pathway signal protein [Caulobacteraceae bacterium]
MRGVLAILAAGGLLLCAAPPARSEASHKGDTETYKAMITLTATIRHGDNSRGVLSVQAGLDTPDPKLRTLADQSAPRLRDAYVRALSVYAAGLSPGASPNVDQIAQQLQRATDRVLGRPGARFLLGTVLVN